MINSVNKLINASKHYVKSESENQTDFIELAGRNKLKIDGVVYSNTQFKTHFSNEMMAKVLGNTQCIEKLGGVSELGSFYSMGKADKFLVAENLYTEMLTVLHGGLKRDKERKKGEKLSQIDFDNVMIVTDVRDNSKVTYDTERGEVNPYSVDAVTEWIKRKDASVKQSYIDEMFAECIIEFNPTKEDTRWQAEYNGKEVTALNPHRLPEWRKEEVAPEDVKPAEVFKSVMKHMLPDDMCRHFVIFWIAEAIERRCYTHLLLSGGRGIGKTILAEIVKAGVGEVNTYMDGADFFDSYFNSEMKYKRFMVFEEVILDEKKIEYFKGWTSNKIAIKEKHVKGGQNYNNFASFLITNNHVSKTKFEYDERKFSVPRLIDQRFDEVYKSGSDDINTDLDEFKNNPTLQAQTFQWIIKKGAEYAEKYGFNSQTEYKSSLFYKIIESNLTDNQRALLDALKFKAEEGLTLIDCKKDLKPLCNMGGERIGAFLASYRDKDMKSYGRVVQRGKSRARFVEIPEWMQPEQTEEIPVDELDF